MDTYSLRAYHEPGTAPEAGDTIGNKTVLTLMEPTLLKWQVRGGGGKGADTQVINASYLSQECKMGS